MAWIQPKTNWSASDFFNAEDYSRMTNNITILHDLATRLYGSIAVEDMEELTYIDIPYAKDFNAFENNIHAINNATYKAEIGSKKTFYSNGNTIDYIEMNRLETACLTLYTMLNNEIAGLTRFAFKLGNRKGIKC